MKVLIATEKPFAPAAVQGITNELKGAGHEVVLLEKYTEKSQLLDAVKDADTIPSTPPMQRKRVLLLRTLLARTLTLLPNSYSVCWYMLSATFTMERPVQS